MLPKMSRAHAGTRFAGSVAIMRVMPASQQNIAPDTPMGANLVSGGATFRTWAPNATSVSVHGDFNNFTEQEDARLVPDGNGHWLGFIPGVTEWQSYKFWITGPDGGGYKRDPYARQVDGSNSDWNCIVRSPAFPWHETGFITPHFPDFVIYQLHVGAFCAPRCPAGGRHISGCDGPRSPTSPTSASTVLQLLPIQEFPGAFSLGYNGTELLRAGVGIFRRGRGSAPLPRTHESTVGGQGPHAVLTNRPAR